MPEIALHLFDEVVRDEVIRYKIIIEKVGHGILLLMEQSEYKQKVLDYALKTYGQSFVDMLTNNNQLSWDIPNWLQPNEGQTPEEWVEERFDAWSDFLSRPEPDYDGADMDES
jgi:hypothetical protein